MGFREDMKTGAHKGFTLVELMVAVVVTAIGMVVVLSALRQCIQVMTASEKQITANELLNRKIWESTQMVRNSSLKEGETSGHFDAPYEDYNWTRAVTEFPEGFENESATLKSRLWKETLTVAWQARGDVRDIVLTRYVPRK